MPYPHSRHKRSAASAANTGGRGQRAKDAGSDLNCSYTYKLIAHGLFCQGLSVAQGRQSAYFVDPGTTRALDFIGHQPQALQDMLFTAWLRGDLAILHSLLNLGQRWQGEEGPQ